MTSVSEGEIVAILQAALPNLLAVYAFGSRVHGTASLDSDLDLAVLVAGKVPPLQAWDLAQTLAIRLDHDVDLLDLREVSTVMQYQVITTGRRLWAKDAQAGLFECVVLSEKTKLDEGRAGLLRDIQCEGKVYGRTAQRR
ncbi:DNA polymerase subunit beta [Massilia sp. Root418]|jgi:predicted nucleotidyltransferase|nr:DNA polymerase subunit beta [Massilia sp. Root418]